jgi:hypothetical protein
VPRDRHGSTPLFRAERTGRIISATCQ